LEENNAMEAIELKQKSSTMFYYKLAEFLNPAYHIAQHYHGDLRNASYTYFNSLIILDGIIDNSISPFKLYEATNGIERSIRLLSALFSKDHKFWEDFDGYKNQYYNTLRKEKEFSVSKKLFTELEFDEVAKGKSAVCYAMVNAMSYLSKKINDKRDKEIICLLEHIHVGFQCKDDIDDFIADLENNQHTYAHVLVIQHINGRSENLTKSNSYLHRYFYVSGLAEYLIQKSIKHLIEAQKIAKDYQLIDFLNFINGEISTAKAQIDEINMLVDKTRVKARLSNENKKVKENGQESLEESICSALKFLNDNLESNMTLSDFMTTAGIGKQWVSNYCAFMLAGHDLTSDIVEKLSTSLYSDNQKGASFNEKIVQDADSLTFKIGALKKIFKDVNKDQLKLLKTFQNKNGGWSTYIDETTLRHQIKLDSNVSLKGWTSAHNCVSASTCYILSLLPDQNELFYKTANFLKKRIDDDGCLNSYWWSSPIYATAWLINAFSQDALLKTECNQSVIWLSRQQNKNGAWLDSISNDESFFYTAMAAETLRNYDKDKYAYQVELGIKFLLNNQTTDGSWKSGRILTIPQTDIIDKEQIPKWRKSSFGVNIIVDDHKRIFTTVTVLKTLISQLNTQ
jgi:hypothetical protein